MITLCIKMVDVHSIIWWNCQRLAPTKMLGISWYNAAKLAYRTWFHNTNKRAISDPKETVFWKWAEGNGESSRNSGGMWWILIDCMHVILSLFFSISSVPSPSEMYCIPKCTRIDLAWKSDTPISFSGEKCPTKPIHWKPDLLLNPIILHTLTYI